MKLRLRCSCDGCDVEVVRVWCDRGCEVWPKCWEILAPAHTWAQLSRSVFRQDRGRTSTSPSLEPLVKSLRRSLTLLVKLAIQPSYCSMSLSKVKIYLHSLLMWSTRDQTEPWPVLLISDATSDHIVNIVDARIRATQLIIHISSRKSIMKNLDPEKPPDNNKHIKLPHSYCPPEYIMITQHITHITLKYEFKTI